MNKVQFSSLLVLVLLICSCNGKKQSLEDSVKNPKNSTPNLDKLRNGAEELYNSAEPSLSRKALETYFFEECKPCDINFLGEIYSKSKLNAAEFRNLICINSDNCSDNVEFAEFYSEVLFNSIDRNPVLFYKTMNNPEIKSNKSLLFVELRNPINDHLEAEKILAKVQSSIMKQKLVNRPDGELERIQDILKK